MIINKLQILIFFSSIELDTHEQLYILKTPCSDSIKPVLFNIIANSSSILFIKVQFDNWVENFNM